ncbi:MAG TPA: RluA family pseudouridine synthase [Acholeplasma sp.]|nr:RluA family pseudouridine synthase [Acholeplasma sp.]
MIEYNFIYDSKKEERLDLYLVKMLPEFSRSKIQKLIKDNYCYVNDDVVKASYKLNYQDEISLTVPEPKEDEVLAENIPLDIIYEDSDIIVINKAKGLVVHPGAGNPSETLVNALKYHCYDLSGINGILRPGIVHRLDKDTSGLLVACKNDYAHNKLAEQFLKQTVVRKYLGIVTGEISHNLGKITAPIARSKDNRLKMAVLEDGKKAVTNFTVLERFNGYSLVEFSLVTGRTHQIRVHMEYIGFPILEDPLYNKAKTAEGQYLHAYILGFNHPRTGKYLEFKTDIPEYFKEFIKKHK